MIRAMRRENEAIVVVGSLNMDFVVQVGALPRPGETVGGWGFRLLPGGKGANQACAAARLGGRVAMIGRVGDDVFGGQLLASLDAAGVETGGVLTAAGEPTGVALIPVERGGQNQIVVAPGANHSLRPEEVTAALDARPARFLLLQLETPPETVAAAAARAQALGMTVVLDPAPAQALGAELLGSVGLLTPNESEARVLLGLTPGGVALGEAAEVARRLLALGPRRVVLKLGAQGAWLADRDRSDHFPAPSVEAVDATAAGDCFNGALAVRLAEGAPLDEAVRFANRAAAISVTRAGAQASLPTRAEVDTGQNP